MSDKDAQDESKPKELDESMDVDKAQEYGADQIDKLGLVKVPDALDADMRLNFHIIGLEDVAHLRPKGDAPQRNCPARYRTEKGVCIGFPSLLVIDPANMWAKPPVALAEITG